jgi:hypothetical protein
MATKMTPLTTFLPLVIPHAVQCPNMVAAQNLRLAAIEFCERTLCWREVLLQTIEVGETVLLTKRYACIHKIEFAEFGSDTLSPVAFTDFNSQDKEQVGTPKYITQQTPQSVRVFPGADGDLKVSVFLKPVNGTAYGQFGAAPMDNYFDQVPLFIYQQHAETIAHGALARILSHKNETYSDPREAEKHRLLFDAKAPTGGSGSVVGQQRAPLRSKTVWF